MAKKKSFSLMTYLKETKVSILTGTLVLFTQTIIILNSIPSVEVEHVSVLRANVQAVLSMLIG